MTDAEFEKFEKFVHQAGDLIGKAALVMCRDPEKGRACRVCEARVAGVVCGAGIVHPDRMGEFMEAYRRQANATTAKFGGGPRLAAAEVVIAPATPGVPPGTAG